jgi:predicted AAA+ superfamily ATPase
MSAIYLMSVVIISMEYKNRLIDAFVTRQLASVGAILIRGPKGCGKT